MRHIVVGVVLLHRGVLLVLVNDLRILEGEGVGSLVVDVVGVDLHYVSPAAGLPTMGQYRGSGGVRV